MNTYEAWTKEEINKFFETTKPSIWIAETRIDPETMKTIYILKWMK